jgi:SAM-dependent methyltransferase
MNYANFTRDDKNPVKRFLQRKRLQDALSLAIGCGPLSRILDYGAGDGELSRLLALRLPDARIYCFEPYPPLREQAIANMRAVRNVEVMGTIDDLEPGSFDLVLCMEVFEHLPVPETEESLHRIRNLLGDSGVGLIGVPLETYLPAAVKGLFRMTRRFGDYDATPLNVLRASLGSPPRNRPLAKMAHGMPYYFHHMGFDHRQLAAQMQPHFRIRYSIASPCPPLGTLLNSELYFLVEKRGAC